MTRFSTEPPVDDREPENCPACDGHGSGFIPWVGTLVCEWCQGAATMCPEDADAIVEAMEEEQADIESLLATCRDTDLTEADFEPPADDLTAADIEEMFRWYEARGVTSFADLFASDWKGRS